MIILKLVASSPGPGSMIGPKINGIAVANTLNNIFHIKMEDLALLEMAISNGMI
jgi:hypothetical protein